MNGLAAHCVRGSTEASKHGHGNGAWRSKNMSLTLSCSAVRPSSASSTGRRGRASWVKDFSVIFLGQWPTALDDDWEPVEYPPLPQDAPPDTPKPPTAEQQRAAAKAALDKTRSKVRRVFSYHLRFPLYHTLLEVDKRSVSPSS